MLNAAFCGAHLFGWADERGAVLWLTLCQETGLTIGKRGFLERVSPVKGFVGFSQVLIPAAQTLSPVLQVTCPAFGARGPVNDRLSRVVKER